MIPSCPPEIRACMNVPVVWEPFLGFDGHAEPTYGGEVDLLCFQEAHGSSTGGLDAIRLADGTTVVPTWDLYFSGDDQWAQQFSLYDRFTPGGIGSNGESLQASRVNTFYGPPFDNRNPWLIVVTL